MHTHTHTPYLHFHNILDSHAFTITRGITRWVCGGGVFTVCVYVRPARVRLRVNRYMPRAESASPPPMGVPVCSLRGACAQVGSSLTPPTAAHTPDPVRVDAVATSAIRVRISTGSSPLHSDARGTHHFFLFFVFFILFFPLSFLVFCPRTQTQRLALAHTLKHTHRIHINKRKRSVAHRNRRTSTTTRHRTGALSRYCNSVSRFAYYTDILK